MSTDLDQASNGGIGLAFLLTEMRDLRKGLEARDERISHSLDNLRGDVNKLSAGLERSQSNVATIESNLGKLGEAVRAIRGEVDEILSDQRIRNASWSGPRKVLTTLALVGAGLGGLVALGAFFGPAVLTLFIP